MGHDDRFHEDTPDQETWMEDEVGQPKVMGPQGIDLTEANPFVTIWMRPRATIRAIVNTDPRWHVVPLPMVAGIIHTLDRAATRNAGDQLPLSAILAVAIVAGPLGGLLGLYVGAWFLGLTGRWLGGRAEPEQLRAAIAWSSVPVLATIPIWMIQLGFLGQEMFTTKTPTLDANPTLALVLLATGIAEVGLGIWAFVIFLKCVGEVQGFSAGRALSSVMLIGLVFLVPIILIVVLLIVVLHLSMR